MPCSLVDVSAVRTTVQACSMRWTTSWPARLLRSHRCRPGLWRHRADPNSITSLIVAPSSIALAQLVTDGVVADAAFVDGSHRFHEVFVDFYFLRKIVRPSGLIIVDEDWTPSVRTAVRYYERNLGWVAIPDAFARGSLWTLGRDPAAEAVPRRRAVRLPDPSFEPSFEEFKPFPN
jgi:hypothetical protein